MRKIIAAALLAAAAISPTLPAAAPAIAAPSAASLSGGAFAGEGFDKCLAPPSADMRSWLASPYRVANIYLAGVNRACPNQPELLPQWITTVTENGWGLVPTYVGSQAPCQSRKGVVFSSTNAAARAKQEADDAAAQMAALGMPPLQNNPIYFDMEPYDTSNSTCNNAVMNFLKSWTREIHVQGYISGVYGTVNTVMKQLVNRQTNVNFIEPDAIWYAHYWSVTQTEHDSTTDEDATFGTYWSGHRMHQWVGGGYSETWNGQKFYIDRNRIDGDVVSAVVAPAAQGPAPYHYAAAPPSGTTLKERLAPTASAPQTATYSSGDDLPIMCQTTTGDNVQGSTVWDQLQDGNYVADIFTTTTGGLTVTPGIPSCDAVPPPDTTPPTATMTQIPPATLNATQTFSWSGTDDSSGVASYDIQYRRTPWNGASGAWQQPTSFTGTTATSASLPMSPGDEDCARVRATDTAGNVGSWSTPVCTARALDDRGLTAKTPWKRTTGGKFYFDTATAAHTKGIELKLRSARLEQVGIVATVCSTCGKVEIFAGSRSLGVIRLANSHFHNRVILFATGVVSLRTRTIHILTGSSGLVRIDGIIVRHTNDAAPA